MCFNLTIAICDDRKDQIDKMKTSVNKYFKIHDEWSIQLRCFDNAFLFLESLDEMGGCDIALLDICMPGILGIDIAKDIRTRRDKTEIIFLTTSDEYAVDAFMLKAAHYLLKPYTQVQFNEAMDRAMISFKESSLKNIVIKTENGDTRRVDIEEIMYIESQGHQATIYTKNGPITEKRRSLLRFMEELEKLSPRQFISPYKGYVVNQKEIKSLHRDWIILRSGAKIPVPKRGFHQLESSYFDYIFQEGVFK